jgi:hypothetical protein
MEINVCIFKASERELIKVEYAGIIVTKDFFKTGTNKR